MNLRNGLGLAGIGALAYAGYQYVRGRRAPTAQQLVAQRTAQLSPTQQLARENVMSLIRLRGQTQANPGATSVDVMMHGTFAHGADWAQPDSSFSQSVRNGRNAVTTSFQWSGSGLEQHRRDAGNQLAPFLRDTQRAAIGGNRRTNVIAHSHGGNVLGHALTNNNVRVDNAVLLATPAMSRNGDPNISWTAQGANRVRNAITTLSAPDDLIQTVGAQTNEWWNDSNNRWALSSGRAFRRPDSVTPQINGTVRQPTGLLSSARDIALRATLSNYHANGSNLLTGLGSGTALGAETARRVQAHSDMHSDLVGAHVSTNLSTLESPVGQAIMGISRIANAVNGVTHPVSYNVRLR